MSDNGCYVKLRPERFARWVPVSPVGVRWCAMYLRLGRAAFIWGGATEPPGSPHPRNAAHAPWGLGGVPTSRVVRHVGLEPSVAP